MIRCIVFVCIVEIALVSPVVTQESRAVLEYEIDAGNDAVWEAFTTTKGLQSWVTPLAEIDIMNKNHGDRTWLHRKRTIAENAFVLRCSKLIFARRT